MNRLRNITLAATCFVAASTLAACTLRFDFTECKVDEDCVALEAPGVFYSCQSEQCVPDTSIECRVDGDCASMESCVSGKCNADGSNNPNNQPDMDAGDNNNMPDMEGDMPAADRDGDGVDDETDNCPDVGNPDQGDDDEDGVGDVCDDDFLQPCAANSECTETDAFCIESRCRVVTNDRCSSIIGDTDSEQVVFIGSILPLTGPYVSIGPPLAKSYELALDDLNNGGGIRGDKVAIVSCDDIGNSQLAREAAQHLVNTVRVDAILGPLFSTPFIDVVSQVTKDAGVFTMTPTATAPDITTLDDDGLAWRLLSSDVLQAEAMMARILDLGANSPTIFYKDDAYGNGLFTNLRPKLIARYGAQGFTAKSYADPATLGFDQMAISQEFGRVIGEAFSQNAGADLLVAIGTTEAVSLVQAYYASATYVPTLFSHGATPDMPKIITADPTHQPTTNGIAPNIFDPVNFPQYDVEFRAKFSGEPPLTISTLTYDAAIMTALGIAGVPEGEEVTGAKIAANMSRLIDPDPMAEEVSYSDPNFISTARTKMQNGESFDYVGVSGECDLDLDTGDIRQPYLNFIGVPNDDQPGTWTLGFDQTFLFAPEPSIVGDWFALCEDTSMCGMTEACVQSLCLQVCDDVNAPTCGSPITQCLDGASIGAPVDLCVPPPQ